MNVKIGPVFVAASILAAASLAACGGSGSSPAPRAIATVVPTATAGSGSGSAATANVKFTLAWPATYARTVRNRAYLSNSTASISIVVNGGTPTIANNPSLVPPSPVPSGTTAPTQTTTVVNVSAPVGNDTFLVTDYDAVNGGGNVLAETSIPYTIVKDINNVVPITLSGVLGKVACAPVAPFVTGTDGAYTIVGPTGEVDVLPEDADGNIIVSPGTIPAVTLSADPTQATVTATSTSDRYSVNVLTSGATVTLTGSGTNDATNATVTGTCTVSRVPAMYVTNYGQTGMTPSVTIYPASASGDATPTATLAGGNTLESGLQFPAVDPKGNLFLTNEGPKPGATYGPTAGYVTVYSPGAGQIGNAAPIATIAGLNRPEGITFDPSGNLFVLSLDRIQEYPPSANGVTGAPAVSSSIVGSNTQITTCYGLAVTSTNIYATCVPYPFYIAYWPYGTNGNVSPTTMEFVGAVTTMGVTASYSEVSWLGIAVDPTSGTMYTPDANNNQNKVYSFPAGSTGMTPPTTIGTGFSQPIGIFEDSGGAFYVANYGSNTIDVFGSSTTLLVGALSATTLTGPDTGLNYPYGVYVR